MDLDGSRASLQIHGNFYILQGTIKGEIVQKIGLQTAGGVDGLFVFGWQYVAVVGGRGKGGDD